mmetsp:Transcript_31410/g.58589  ORF Transcript_31410/g.58589 Transcript_31410/m.58589 type:complete len:172 (+) Transcript_31410:69-584(+)
MGARPPVAWHIYLPTMLALKRLPVVGLSRRHAVASIRRFQPSRFPHRIPGSVVPVVVEVVPCALQPEQLHPRRKDPLSQVRLLDVGPVEMREQVRAQEQAKFSAWPKQQKDLKDLQLEQLEQAQEQAQAQELEPVRRGLLRLVVEPELELEPVTPSEAAQCQSRHLGEEPG